VVAGVVAGTWALKGDTVSIDWFEPRQAPAGAAVAAEVQRVSLVLDRDLRSGA
jgi:hypothetical protein